MEVGALEPCRDPGCGRVVRTWACARSAMADDRGANPIDLNDVVRVHRGSAVPDMWLDSGISRESDGLAG